jgi:hypothetical protein
MGGTMSDEKSKGEDILKDPEVIKLILDYSQFELTKMVIFQVKDIQEIKFVEPMIHLAFTFILTCQTYAKIFKFQTPSFQFTYNDIGEGISVSLCYDEDHIDEENLKKYLTDCFSPEAKMIIENLFTKANAEDMKAN